MNKIKAILLCTMLALSIQAHSATVDIVFALDSSGSLGQDGWDIEKAFLQEVIGSIESHETADIEYRYGIVVFSNVVNVEYRFTDDQSLPALYSGIDNLAWLRGTTATRDAINTSLSLFSTDSTDDAFKHLVLMTDGNPYPYSSQSVCETSSIADNLSATGVQATVVGFGNNWSVSAISCLVNDLTGIIPATGFAADPVVDRVVLSAVPVPSALWLLGSGILGLVGLARRQKI